MFRLLIGLIGITAVIAATALLFGGGSLLWIDSVLADEAGFVNSQEVGVEVDGFALVAGPADIELAPDLPFELELATIRLRMENQISGQGIFIGVAPTPQVDAYLADMPHAEVDHLGSEGLALVHRTGTSADPPAAPAQQVFWVTSVSGTGEQELAWDIEEGEYSLVVMNEDAADGMSFDAMAGVRIPAMRPLSVTLLIGGALALSLGTILVAIAL